MLNYITIIPQFKLTKGWETLSDDAFSCRISLSVLQDIFLDQAMQKSIANYSLEVL